MLKDSITKKYMSDNRHFADVFNYYLYNGEEVIKTENLKELDTVSLMPNDVDREKFRDIYKMANIKTDGKTKYILLGIENQSEIDNAMVIRTMLYDALSYDKQRKQLARKNKDAKIELGKDYITGIRKNDKFTPVITLVIYFGTDKWNYNQSLYEILDVDDRLLKYISNYKLNIIKPSEMSDDELNMLKTDLRLALRLIKKSNNKEAFIKEVENNDDYKNMDFETVNLVNVITDLKIKLDSRKERTNMCKAVEDLRRDEREKGIAIGREEERAKMSKTVADIRRDEREKGKQEEKENNIKLMYSNGADVNTIAKLLNMKTEDINRIINN